MRLYMECRSQGVIGIPCESMSNQYVLGRSSG